MSNLHFYSAPRNYLCLILITILILMPLSIVKVKATNESSYQYGYLSGSQTAPDSGLNANSYQESDNCGLTNASVYWKNDAILPAVTNTTACHNGFIAGWKTWCTNNAVDCVGNLTSGYFPDFFLKIHQEYQRGYTASNGSYSLCPINENNAYCTGWYNNMGERAGECGDNPNNSTLFSSHNLLGCPLDYLTNSQMIKPSSLIGTWNYVNWTISGKMVFSDYGNFTIKIPSKTPFGDYELQGSWGSPGHSLLTLCYETQSCVNNTLTTITPNQITFLDNSSRIIHLTKPSNQSLKPEVGTNTKLVEGSNGVNLLGTWSIDNQSKSAKITFDSFIKYAHSKWPYCCDVNIQKFIVVYNIQKSVVKANIGHRVSFEGYWNSSIYGSSPAYLQGFPSSLDLCAYNIQDHGEYHDNISSPLSGCTKMTVNVIDNNHLRLYIPSYDKTIYLTRLVN